MLGSFGVVFVSLSFFPAPHLPWQLDLLCEEAREAVLKCLHIYRFTFSFPLVFSQKIYLHYKSIKNMRTQLALYTLLSLNGALNNLTCNTSVSSR
uniref:Uncharacterized protein n=1 Tax=Gallus gallus TaxID=9031 RepID=A0A8V0Y847_CHICK